MGMSWFNRKKAKLSSEPEEKAGPNRIPTVKFDASRVTDDVKLEIKEGVAQIEEIEACRFDEVYDAALHSVSAGGDLHVLYEALMRIGADGITRRKAEEIARHINDRATSLMNRNRQKALGIEDAVWLYSGAPCMTNTHKPTAEEIRQDAAHKQANGTRFKVSKGMPLDGKWTWPGRENGCRCVSKSVISGFD
jgi:uncharacterized protein with gpF-like domain